MAKTAGYSGTPLAKKLGIKPEFITYLENAPEDYFDFFVEIPEAFQNPSETDQKKNFIHFFTKDAEELEQKLPQLKETIQQNGMIWVSWPKKASKVPTDVTEDVIRDYALKIGLVDVKVCAVSNIWSGLKLVIPVKDRKNNG